MKTTKAKRPTQSRKTLAKVIDAEDSYYRRQQLAKYGDQPPALLYLVDYWQSRVKPGPNGRRDLTTRKEEREALRAMFMTKFVHLDANWFEQMAEAMRFHSARKNETGDQVRIRINDPALLTECARLQCHQLTAEEIRQRVGYKGAPEAFRRMLQRMQIPYAKGRLGRPKNI